MVAPEFVDPCGITEDHKPHEYQRKDKVLRYCLGKGPKPSRLNRPGDSQPMPTANDNPIVHHEVQKDLEARLQLGISRYGQPLQPFNGRSFLKDAYEEILDLAVYLKGRLMEEEQSDS